MSQIVRDVFQNPEQVERVIQKVIDYQHTDPELLKKEVSEYVVTDHISRNVDKMLDWIEQSMAGNVKEVGAWVSGFYGSGKSSLTKYLGFAFDSGIQIEGRPFSDLLGTQIDEKTVSQRLKTLVKRINAAVVMLDLATQNIADKPVTDILLLHVRQWAGLSKDESIAEFEQFVQKDNRWDEMLNVSQQEFHRDWMESHNKTVIAKGLARRLAARLYPEMEFNFDSKESEADSTQDKVRKIIEIVHSKTGAEAILFLIDEVGQYVGANQDRILDMQGLVQNLKTVGKGKVLVIATAQQTLLETDAKTAINSPFLVKLKDRFPMQVTLQSSDIEEICYRRLLRKSPEGEKALSDLFAQNGQKLIARTKLNNNIAYESSLDEKGFVHLYPFLPTHFKLLLSLLGELAKGRGGYGLRSAIKVVQDVLTGGHVGGDATDGIISCPFGTLVSGQRLFDVLHDDIEASDRAFMQTVQKTLDAYQDKPEFIPVIKTLAIANLLPDFQATPKNIAALMQDTVQADISEQSVTDILHSLSMENTIPVSDQSDGSYHFLNEVQERLDHERNDYQPVSSDYNRVSNELFSEVFKNLLRVQAHTGLSIDVDLFEFGKPMAIRGKGAAPLRLTLALREQNEKTQATAEAVKKDSLASQNTIYLLSTLPVDMDLRLREILKSEYMGNRYASDTQAKDYAKDQNEKARVNRRILEGLLRQAFSEGEIYVRGTERALTPGGEGFENQMKAYLQQLAEKVFDKYIDAAVSMRTGGARFLLRAAPGKPLEKSHDPLGLIDVHTERLQIRHKPAVDYVLDQIGRQDETQGHMLLEHFTRAPYGWSKEVTLYILAALLAVGLIELNISGRTHSTVDAAVEEAFASPKNFKSVGVRIRQDQFSDDDLLLCHKFLTEHGVSGLRIRETDLWNAAYKFVVEKSSKVDQLDTLLTSYQLAGTKQLRQLKGELEHLKDANLSAFLSSINDDKKLFETGIAWLEELEKVRSAGLFETIGEVHKCHQAIEVYPAKFTSDLLQSYENLKKIFATESFIKEGTQYRQFINSVKVMQGKAQQEAWDEYNERYKQSQAMLQNVVKIYQLTDNEIQELSEALPAKIKKGSDYAAINVAMASVLKANKEEFEAMAAKIRARRPSQEKSARKVKVPVIIRDETSLQKLIDELQQLKAQMSEISEIEVQLGD